MKDILPEQDTHPDSAFSSSVSFFWIWLILRTIAWSLLVYLCSTTAPIDVVEMVVWGQDWLWGYHKHPPLPAWLADFALHLFGGSFLGVYFLTYLCTAVTIWAVWKLASDFLSPRLALLAALATDGIAFYNLLSGEFNHNVLSTTFSALVALSFWNAVRYDRYRSWIGLGIFMGLALLSKYSTVLLGFSLTVFLAANPGMRVYWRRSGPYLALLLTLLVISPHIHWLISEDYPTIRYITQRSVSINNLPEPSTSHAITMLHASWSRVSSVLVYLANQAFALIPCILILGWYMSRRHTTVNADARWYIATLICGPLLIQILFSLTTGAQLRSMWSMANWPWTGLLLLSWFQLRPSTEKYALRSLLGLSIFMMLLMPGWSIIRQFSAKAYRQDFPAQAFAEEVTRRWWENYGTPLPIAAGGYWLTGNVHVFSPDHPLAYASGTPVFSFPTTAVSPWMNDATFQRVGGVVLWEEPLAPSVIYLLSQRYPGLNGHTTFSIPYANPRIPPARIGMAFLPPR